MHIGFRQEHLCNQRRSEERSAPAEPSAEGWREPSIACPRVATETIVGVVFSVALAMGSMMASGEELIDALFGGAGALSRAEIIFGLAGSCVVVAFILTQKNKLVVMLVSSEVAKTAGINVRLLDFLYLEMFSLTIALGLRYLGAPS